MKVLRYTLVFVAAALCEPAHAQTAHVDSIPMIKVPSQMPELPPIIIKGKEFTTRELVKRAMKGERSKLAGHADATYLITTHVSVVWDEKKEVETQVTRVYGDSTGTTRRVLLASRADRFKKKDGEWVYDKDVDTHHEPYRIQDFDEGRFTAIPVYLEHDEQFDFEYIERRLEKDRVVFHVRFKPKSDFSEMPNGEVWIDGDGFRVVHEIYDFTNNPFPMLIKGVRRISVQWTELSGGEWVPKQIAAEVDLRKMPFAPRSVSFKQTWEDFRFDQGYDERLFGKRDTPPVAIARAPEPEPTRAIGPPDTVPVAPDSSVADSTGVMAVVPDSLAVHDIPTTVGGPSMLAELQRQDDAAYSPEVQITNRAFIDSTAALHDSLGVAGLGGDIALYGSEWRLGFDPRLEDWDYNRVEGFLFGGEATFGRADDRSQLSVWGGYATGSEEFRYHGAFTTKIPKTDEKLALTLSARHLAEPFGSNRIALNSLRAFVGGADDQDYVDREAVTAMLTLEPWEDVSFDAGFEAAREEHIPAETDFSLFGDMDEPNATADSGDDQALFTGFRLDGRRWLNAQLMHRWAEDGLGSDFDYHRTDLVLNARGFVLGRQELDLTLRGVATSGGVPLQQFADIGGLSTVRGYHPRTLVGDYSATARLEYLFPYDVFASTHIPLLEDAGIQFIPWADGGLAKVDGQPDESITSVGIGLQRYLWPFDNAANIRLDFAWPLDNPQDDFAVYLWFTALR